MGQAPASDQLTVLARRNKLLCCWRLRGLEATRGDGVTQWLEQSLHYSSCFSPNGPAGEKAKNITVAETAAESRKTRENSQFESVSGQIQDGWTAGALVSTPDI